MEPFTVEVHPECTIVHLAADTIPEELLFDVTAKLNEEHNLPHFGEHEDKIEYGLMFSMTDNGPVAELVAMLDDGSLSTIKLVNT